MILFIVGGVLMSFATRLYDLRIMNGMSQQEVSDYLQLTRGAVANYEKGIREPSLETLEALGDLFNVSIDYLLDKADHTTALLVGQPKVLVKARKLDDLIKQLSPDGMDKLIERAEELLELPKYRK